MRFHSAITYRLGRVGGRGETTTRLPAWRCSPAPVVWTCRARRHVAFPPPAPAAIAILSFPFLQGKGAMGSEFRGAATGLPLSCCMLLASASGFCFFVRPAAHASSRRSRRPQSAARYLLAFAADARSRPSRVARHRWQLWCHCFRHPRRCTPDERLESACPIRANFRIA